MKSTLKSILKPVGSSIASGARTIKEGVQSTGSLIAEGVRDVQHHTLRALNVRPGMNAVYEHINNQPTETDTDLNLQQLDETPVTLEQAIDQAMDLVQVAYPQPAQRMSREKPTPESVGSAEIELHISNFLEELVRVKSEKSTSMAGLENTASWILTDRDSHPHWHSISPNRRENVERAATMILQFMHDKGN